MRMIMLISLLILLFFLTLTVDGLTFEEYEKLLVRDSLGIAFIRPDDRLLGLFPSYRIYRILSNLVETNAYVVENVGKNNFSIVYFPLRVGWREFLEVVSNFNVEIISDFSILLRVDGEVYYVVREGERLVAVLPSLATNYYYSARKGVEKDLGVRLKNFVEEISCSNFSGIFVVGIPREVKDILKANVVLIDEKYNLLQDIDYLYVFWQPNAMSASGRIFLASSRRVGNLFSPRAMRGVNVITGDAVPFHIGLSVNSEVFGDLLEAFFPDTVRAFPALKTSLNRALSGTVYVVFHSPLYQSEVPDITVFIGIKSQKEAEGVLKGLLGLFGKYRSVAILGKRVFEIEVQNGKVYLHTTGKEFVLTFGRERMEKYLASPKASKPLITNFPTVSLGGLLEYVLTITDRDREMFRNTLLTDVPRRVDFYLDIDDSLKFVNFKIFAESE